LDSYRPLFWLSLGSTLIAALVVVPIREKYQHETRGHTWRDWIPHRSFASIAKLSLVMGLIGLGLGFSVQLLSLWFYLKFGVSGDVLGAWYAGSEGLSTVAMMLVPHIARRIGTANTVLATQGLAALFLALMVSAPTASFAAALYLVRNFLMNLAWPAQQSYIMGVVDPSERATASSTTNAAWGIANSISPAISGAWLDARLLALPLLAGAGSYVLSVAIFYGFFRKVRLPEESAALQRDRLMQTEPIT
ncbi:MAG: MFS transporter, partial [Chloroflexi bacterium]|nr:MFS transporter [Chloroflexota bacterium]